MVPQKRVAIYARVSTLEKGQDPETQLVALRAYAEHRGFVTAGEYVEYASGVQEDRPQYRALLAAAKKRQINVVLVWCYDHFARSTQALVNALKEFQSFGVDFISYQENIDTTTPQGELIFTVMASIAQFERALISERVKAGMARAKAQGKRISRPRYPSRFKLVLPHCVLRDTRFTRSARVCPSAIARCGIMCSGARMPPMMAAHSQRCRRIARCLSSQCDLQMPDWGVSPEALSGLGQMELHAFGNL